MSRISDRWSSSTSRITFQLKQLSITTAELHSAGQAASHLARPDIYRSGAYRSKSTGRDRHDNRIESTYNASNLSLKHRHDNRIEKLVRLADIEFTASLEGQAGVKGLAVGAWLISECGAVKAAFMEYEYKKHNDDD